MHFFKILSFALLPLMVVANPGAIPEAHASPMAAPEANAQPQPGLLMADAPKSGATGDAAAVMAMMELSKRADLTDLLSQLPQLLKSIGEFLNPEFLDNIHTVVTQLAYLLGGETSKQTKNLLGTASGLLTNELLAELGDILTNAHSLLSAKFVHQTKGLINDVAPLVSAITQVISVLLSAILGD